MAGRIPRVFINDLLARTDIVDLIDARVKLKKQGKNFHACCPFHNEKTHHSPLTVRNSFTTALDVARHGNAIDFLMNYDKLEFVETVEELAAMHNLEVPFEAGSIQPNRAPSGANALSVDGRSEYVLPIFTTTVAMSHAQNDRKNAD